MTKTMTMMVTICAAAIGCGEKKGDKDSNKAAPAESKAAESTNAEATPTTKDDSTKPTADFSTPFQVELDKFKVMEDDDLRELRIVVKVRHNAKTPIPVDACVSLRDKKGIEIDSISFTDDHSVERGGTVELKADYPVEKRDWNKVATVRIHASSASCMSDEILSNQVELKKDADVIKEAALGKTDQPADKQPFIVDAAELTFSPDDDGLVRAIITMKHRAEQPVTATACLHMEDEDGFEVENIGLKGDGFEAGGEGTLRGKSGFGFGKEDVDKIAKMTVYTAGLGCTSDTKKASSVDGHRNPGNSGHQVENCQELAPRSEPMARSCSRGKKLEARSTTRTSKVRWKDVQAPFH